MSATWSVVIVVPRASQYVALARGFNPRNINFPGGSRDLELDAKPVDTVVRELYEETGLRTSPEFVRLITTWNDPQKNPVYAYLVPQFLGRLRAGPEGRVFWTAQIGLFTSPSSEFSTEALLIFRRILPAPTAARG